MKSFKCGLCGKSSRTHRKANFGKSRKGRSALKIPRKRTDRVRRWDFTD